MADTTSPSPQCPVNEPHCEYLNELLSLRQQVTNLQREARTDALTGLFNYRHFDLILNQEMERVRRSGLPMVLVLCDIDHFKQFNDTYGHEVGNRMLQQVARVIDQQLRQLDTACRYGGEEFALIFPSTSLSQAKGVAERIRTAVAAVELELSATQKVAVTLSLGLASFVSSESLLASELVANADEQLYRAKKQGRNCVVAPDNRVTNSSALEVTADEKSALFASITTDYSNDEPEPASD
ncbi:GGDEF domain-containing protein [Gilvimarinus polysaccharolyticus]|uniref:GGDEF domain-containing protein n=1 Tax=Gilvimarinus polysaccharolyticus TaxID=863921 RepID=UPI0006738DD6|nr:GGDEF domain-containing protein [Gilvimarinus polysaccharolyticus]